MATLTYGYADQTAVLGPLSTLAEPHTYDLCAEHAERLTVPRGWDVVRLAFDPTPPPAAASDPDDLLALADAVRERGPAARSATAAAPLARPAVGEAAYPDDVVEGARRGHLRALRST